MVLYQIFGIGTIMLQKSLGSHTYLWDSSFFVLKEWRQFKQQKWPLFFNVIPLNTPDNFFTAR